MTTHRTTFAALIAVIAFVLTISISIAQQGQNTNSNTNQQNRNSGQSDSSMNDNMSREDRNMNSNMGGSMNSNSGMNSNMTGQSMSGALNSTDRKFMMEAAMGGLAEVEMARVALQNASSDSVKQYAQKMIDDHTTANQGLMQIAASKGVTLPTGPDAKHMRAMEKLRGMTGAQFDREYIKMAGNKDHRDMEKLFQREVSRGADPEVKAFASKTLPVVQEHLRLAQEINASMTGGGASGNTGGGMNGNANSNMNGNMNGNTSNANRP